MLSAIDLVFNFCMVKFRVFILLQRSFKEFFCRAAEPDICIAVVIQTVKFNCQRCRQVFLLLLH